ncbi:hypothetical protein [Tunturiibacter lichenicola]|uniref:hypothetical protein n=1 Tax=Tunturiibacter lichenicola TaxID=2051959 RepID=UPI0021B26B7A|nr:hypothetical protein [Edaphobacter lichenicola]
MSVSKHDRWHCGNDLELARSGDCDDQGKVGEYQDASASELQPSPVIKFEMGDADKTSSDKNKVPDASNEDHQRVWPLQLARSEKGPQLTQASLH